MLSKMNKGITFFLAFAALIAMAFVSDNSKIKFAKSVHSFGKIKHNQAVTHEFSFVNTSSSRIIIEDATAECGCTKPTFPMQPIQPGKSGTISVTYDAKTLGTFNKKITIKLVNDDAPVILSINGEVVQ